MVGLSNTFIPGELLGHSNRDLISLIAIDHAEACGADGLFARAPHLDMDLTASQWSLLSPLLMSADPRKRRGRPHRDTKGAMYGILWVLRTGARWADLPSRYPPHQTCHRRFRQWLSDGTLFACFRLLAADLDQQVRSSAADDPPVPDDVSATGTPARSWKWHTAQLLECPLARQALGQTADGGVPVKTVVRKVPRGPRPPQSRRGDL